MEDPDALPEMPRPGGAGHALESLASMVWTLTFLAYSSSTVLSEFGTGPRSAWTVLFVAAPVILAGLHGALENRPGASTTLAKYLAYIAAPACLQLARPADAKPGNVVVAFVCDALTFATLWLPVDLKLLPELGPTGNISIWASLTGSLSAVNTFAVLRPFLEPGRTLGYSFKLSPADLLVAILFGLSFCLVGTPVVLAIRYGQFHRPRGLRLKSQAAVFMGLYFAALGEEILFRGIALNMLERGMRDPQGIAPLVLASVLCGLGNLKSKAHGLPVPNWRAAVIAALASIPYGLVWRRTGLVTASAISHAFVQYSFRTLFYKQNKD
jgi:membrane protease YdiL (CAAX protease family)